MKWRAAIALLAFSSLIASAGAQSSTEDSSVSQQTQVHDYWVDPSTSLMWTAKDNGKDLNWKQAMRYCRDLRLAGYSDWSLPTIDQLQGIYDGSGFATPPPQKGAIWALAGKAKGPCF